ncbi:MAG: MFS transporter [Bacteroidales bacterium]|nr:MFS transporter [Bacteroidales bacterium]
MPIFIDNVIIIGVIIFSVFANLCGVSGNIYQLIIFRVLQEVGTSFMFATSVSILSSVSPSQKRGKILEFNATAICLGLLAGPTLGGIIVNSFGWRYIFVLAFSISIFAEIFAIMCLYQTLNILQIIKLIFSKTFYIGLRFLC